MYRTNSTAVAAYHNFLISYATCVIVFGLIGNMLTLFTISSSRSLRPSTKFLFCAIAVADSLTLCTAMAFKDYELIAKHRLGDESVVACKVTYFFIYSFYSCSIWLVGLLALERLLLTIYPQKLTYLRNWVYAAVPSLIICAIVCCFYLPLWFTQYDFENRTCDIRIPHVSLELFTWLDFAIGGILPHLMIVVLSGLIIQALWLQKKKLNSISGGKDRQLKATKMLLSVALIQLFLGLPTFVLLTISNKLDAALFPAWSDDVNDAIILTFIMLTYTNCGANFYVYIATTPSFRKSFVNLVGYHRCCMCISQRVNCSCCQAKKTAPESNENSLRTAYAY